ncbi:MAG: response regulator transcription factor [Clostridia bacterium]|nr:response regulator transcription factor [Clostridia bacterium]
MFNVLVVEDDRNIRNLIEIKLRSLGYNVVTAENGKDALEKLSSNHLDIMLVDAMMPIMDGYTFVKTVREDGNNIPAIMVTAKGSMADKSQGFDVGVDDYMVKPIEFDELSLRIKAVLRRAKIVSDRKITVGETVLDYDTLTVSNGVEKVVLTKTEFGIIYKLLSYPERSFSKSILFEEFWAWDSETEEDIVKVYINRIRNKIAPFKEIDVETIRGIGYRGVRNEK